MTGKTIISPIRTLSGFRSDESDSLMSVASPNAVHDLLADLPVAQRSTIIADYWWHVWSSIQLTILREKGESDLFNFKRSIMRKHQRNSFLAGVDKLGIDRGLPPAVIAARYHYLSNMIGGQYMEYVEESPQKVWIRYFPPSWSFPGVSLAAVPASAEIAMFEGWHQHNGRSLGSKKLAFVVTKTYHRGDTCVEGYFVEREHDLEQDEFLQFEHVNASPKFDHTKAPRLAEDAWPQERLAKANRSFARGYVVDAIRTLLDIYGQPYSAYILAEAARLVAVQFSAEMCDTMELSGRETSDFLNYCSTLAGLAGENFDIVEETSDFLKIARTNHIISRLDASEEISRALFELIQTTAKMYWPNLRVTLSYLDRSEVGNETWLIEKMSHDA